VKSVERPSAGRTTLDTLINILRGVADEVGTTEVVVRTGNGAQGKSKEIFVTTPTWKGSLSRSSTGEPRI